MAIVQIVTTDKQGGPEFCGGGPMQYFGTKNGPDNGTWKKKHMAINQAKESLLDSLHVFTGDLDFARIPLAAAGGES